jgi:hypothetical protein
MAELKHVMALAKHPESLRSFLLTPREKLAPALAQLKMLTPAALL